jgi:YD repeat-containing protein
MGRRVASTDPNGAVHAYHYDEQGMLVERVDYVGTAVQRSTRMQYDLLGRLTWETDAGGKLKLHTYDAVGNETGVVDGAGTPDARTTSSVYDGMGRVLSQTNALGVVTQYTYGASGDLLRKTVAAGIPGEEQTTLYAYDDKHQLTMQANLADCPDGTLASAGLYSAYQYDTLGNRTLIREFDAANGARDQRFAYDAMGNATSSIDASGLVTTYAYDGAGNLIASTETGGGEVRTTAYAYDLENRLVKVTDPMGGSTEFTLD